MNLAVFSLVICATGSASTHLVKVSMATIENLYLPRAFGNGPSISIPHVVNGQDSGMVLTLEPAGVSASQKIGLICKF